jgi:hypothetical protein
MNRKEPDLEFWNLAIVVSALVLVVAAAVAACVAIVHSFGAWLAG